MKNRLCPLFFIAALSLTACGGKSYSPKDYILELDYTGNFKILQLTDTHIADKDDQDLHYDFLEMLIKDANKSNDVNLIVITGDLFTFASKSTARKYFDFFNKQQIPWTVVFGNHDEQTYFSVDWMTSELNSLNKKREDGGASYCMFKDIQDDDVQGNCNFAINLKKAGVVTDQLIMMDSNRYYFGGYFGYDYFKKEQQDWYSELVDQTTADNGGVVKSLMFYHIPLPEVNNAYDEGDIQYGEKREDCCPPDENSGFFDVIKAKGSTTAMFFGHDHINNFEADYQGVKFCYGIKSTNRIYFDEDMLGYQTIEIDDAHKVNIVRSYHTYGEVRNDE